MHLNDALKAAAISGMAYTPKKAEIIITGLEKPINDHLLKLWTMPWSEHRGLWMFELINWIDEVSEIVLKPASSSSQFARLHPSFCYRILFEEPFGGVGLQNLIARLKRLQRQRHAFATDISLTDLFARLEHFHVGFSHQASMSLVSEDALRDLLGDL